MHLPASRVLELLQARQTELDNEIDDMNAQVEEAQGKMSDLKVLLSDRFGAAINLDR